jgi:hypothetical protein
MYSQILFMEDIVKSFAERLRIEPDVARQGISITCRHFLHISEPIKATGLLSMLPSSLTDLLSAEEKNEITLNQENIPLEEVMEKISIECFNGDKKKAKKVYEEVINLIKSKIW